MKNKIIRSFILYTVASCISCPVISAEEYDISCEIVPEDESVINEESCEPLPEEAVIYEDTTFVDEFNTQKEYVELYDETVADYEEVIFEDITDYGTDSNAVGTADTSESVDEEQSGEEGSAVDLDSVVDDEESTDTGTGDESTEESVDDTGEQTEEMMVSEVDASDFLGVRSFTAVSKDGTITATLITENTLYPSLYFGFYEDVEKAPVYTAVIQEDGSFLFEFTMFEEEQGVAFSVVPADAEG